MKIELKQIKIRDLVDGYFYDSSNDSVVAYGRKLNVRPPYQREFVYDDEQQKSVINTIVHNFPLNVMYWVKKKNGTFELLDGQQRTLSICRFVVENAVSLKIGNKEYERIFDNLSQDEKEQVLNYELMVYFCEGTETEQLDWFDVVNIAGEKLTAQERRNAVFNGSWVTDAKRYFSKNGCVAAKLGSDYLKGSSIRQEYLETVIKWMADKDEEIRNEKKPVDAFMRVHQHDEDASDMWAYFQNVINWVKATFPNYRPSMKGVDWGLLFNEYGTKQYKPATLEKRIRELIEDEDVTKESGIYEYLLSGENITKERLLSIRAFKPKEKQAVYERQKGICVRCGKHFELSEMEADHIKPWHEGGHTTIDNCQMLCKDCNRRKSGK